MKKEEYIRRYGKAAYQKMRQQSREWNKENPERVQETSKLWKAANQEKVKAHPEKSRERAKLWAVANPDKDKARQREGTHKGGKYYAQRRQHQMNGIPHEKELIRSKHANLYRAYKRLIAQESQIHHGWLNDGTSNYRGVALVEKNQHQHGYIDVIQILEGEITLFTEAEIRNRGQAV